MALVQKLQNDLAVAQNAAAENNGAANILHGFINSG